MTPDAANERVEQLFERFRDAYEAGKRPHVGELLETLEGEDRQELGSRIDRYLMDAPRRSWDPDAFEGSLAQMAVERVWESLEGVSGTWPELLPQLRNEARLTRGKLVERLAEALGFPRQTDRVADYYHLMEHGMLPAERVSRRVLEALAGIVGTTVERLQQAGRAPAAFDEPSAPAMARLAMPDPDYRRSDEPLEDAVGGALGFADGGKAAPDALDRLFLEGD